jgi:hypothetical protein
VESIRPMYRWRPNANAHSVCAATGAKPAIARGRGPGTPLGEVRDRRKLFDHARCLVGQSVVHDDHLDVDAALTQRTLDRFRQEAPVVVARDHDRDELAGGRGMERAC